MKWIEATESQPDEDVPVLVMVRGEPYIGVRRWEYSSFEETFQAFSYWDDYNNEGEDWREEEVRWMPIPGIQASTE